MKKKIITKRFMWILFNLILISFSSIFIYTMTTTLNNTQPIIKAVSQLSGYYHVKHNSHLFQDHHTENFYDLIDPFDIEYKTHNPLDLPESEFSAYITYLKSIDKDISSPCQTYSYLWSKYFDMRDISYKYHHTSTHTFLVVERDFGYSIVDQQFVDHVTLA